MTSRFGRGGPPPKLGNMPTPDIQRKFQEALSLHQRGQVSQAQALYKEILQNDPKNSDSLHLLGVCLHQRGDLDQAFALISKAILLNPKNAPAYGSRGNVLKDMKRLEEALSSYEELIRLQPKNAGGYMNAGNVLAELKEYNAALTFQEQAIKLKPDYAEAYNNRGNAFRGLGQFSEALVSYETAINLKPDYAEAYSNRGNVLIELKRFGESIVSSEKAINLKPNYAEAYSNRGTALSRLGRFSESLLNYEKAISLKPDDAEAYSNRGSVLRDLGKLGEALRSYEKAISLKPDDMQFKSNRLFCLNYLGSLSTDDALEMALQYGLSVSSKASSKFSDWANVISGDRLRIGFVSGDLINHPVGFFVEGILKYISRNDFECFAFPTRKKEDDLTARLRPGFAEWTSIVGMNDSDAARIIHQKGIHCLIDLSGHTGYNRLGVFAYKPAPVQISWLGYFATTGLPEMEFLLGDPFVTPMSEANHFSEKIWQMPESYICFTPPQYTVPVGPLPVRENGFVTFGSFNHLTKMGDRVVELWARVLKAVPNSKLFLKTVQLADNNVVARVVEQFSRYGLPPERLILEGPSKRSDLLASYNRVDIGLDPFPYPGGTTSAEALWMGVPVLTLKGDRFLSHVGESICHNVGHSDWIAANHDDYVAKAAYFSGKLDRLSFIRENLREKVLRSPLFDAERFARHFEQALRGMWASRQSGI